MSETQAPDRLRPTTAARATSSMVPPQAPEAEIAVLASMMLDSLAITTVVQVLAPDDFYRPAHRTICAAIHRLFEKGEAVDIVTLAEALGRAGDLEKVGGEVYLAELLGSTATAANVEYHAKIIREKSVLRKMIAAAREIAEEAYGGPDDVMEFLDRSEHRMFEIAEKGPRKSFVAIRDLLHDSFEKIEELYHNKRLVTGVPSGYLDLDTLTSGFQPSEFIVVAGRPSMGKTAFMLNVAQHVAVEEKQPVAVFSLEMSRESLVHRMLASEARVDSNRLRTGFLRESEWPRLTTAAGRLGDADFYIDDTAGTTALEIRAKARRLMVETKNRLALVVIDYMQLIRGHGRAENRQQEVSGISRSLKALAKELRIPVVALSQLKRPTDVKEGMRRPVLSDLRECVTGDTLVVLADGRRVPIEELVGTEPEVVSIDERGELIRARSDRVWKVGHRPVLRIALASGRSIRVTVDHRLRAGEGWRRASELATGDRLALARRLPEPERPDTWPDSRVALLGQLIGDGSYLAGQPMRYTSASEANSRLVAGAARGEFGAEVKRYRGRGAWHQLLIAGNGNRWHPAGVNAWLGELGVFGQRSFEKRVPAGAFQLSNRQVALLLRHLWATDGCIHTRTSRRSGGHVAHFSTSSCGLASDVAALLLRLGVVARIRVVRQAVYRPTWMVTVTGAEPLRRFLQVVGAFGPREEAADKLRNALQGVEANSNVDTLPREVFSRTRRRMQAAGVTQRAMAALRGTSYGGTSHYRFAPSRATVVGYARLLSDEALAACAADDLFWDRIVSIEPDGEADVYDLTVPGPACWLADGIVSHNSGSIEQDADVVIFINRPEVYAPSPEAEGLAEIIIGKQRNGPIGTVKLFFHKSHTRFENLARAKE
jgi:replicative DNA helicase